MHKFPTKWAVHALTAAALAVMLAACGTSGGKSAQPVVDEDSTDPNVIAAVELYKKNCMVCHGPQLEGTMANTKMDTVGATLTPDQIKNKIMNGGNGMIAYKDRLSEEEIKLLTDWLATKK
ncbi:MAG: cytochrome c family protein [Paenibacillaceae bacterium]|jgi:mono/diheme cytochrome c family protein|nr:cytochrome c family protein [Paenibacillaceae bacterium]